MIRKMILFTSITVLLSSCMNLYRYNHVNSDYNPGKDFSIRQISIMNPELLMLDKTALSNSLIGILEISMSKNGLTLTTNSQDEINLSVAVEGNDILNNTQAITLMLQFYSLNKEKAVFMITAKSRDILFDKENLSHEFENVFASIIKK